MKASRFLLAPVTAVFDLKTYRDARDEKFGTAVLYSLYLSFLFCAGLAIIITAFMPKANAFADWLKTQWPAMTFSSAGMKLDNPGPITLTHPVIGPLATFDDTKTTISEEEMGNVPVFITSKMIYTRSPGGMQARALPTAGERVAKSGRTLRVDGETVLVNYRRYKPVIIAAFLIIMLIAGFVSRLLAALIFALVGFLIQLALPRRLDFEALYALASFAFSIGLWIGFLRYVPGAATFVSAGFGIVVSLAYFILAIAVQPKVSAA